MWVFAYPKPGGRGCGGTLHPTRSAAHPPLPPPPPRIPCAHPRPTPSPPTTSPYPYPWVRGRGGRGGDDRCGRDGVAQGYPRTRGGMPMGIRWVRCTEPSCPEVHEGTGRCPTHRGRADRARGTARQRGYDNEHEQRFRVEVLARHPVCVVCDVEPATVADHWPLGKRELMLRGFDSNDSKHGRGLCASCHSRSTSQRERGGFERSFDT